MNFNEVCVLLVLAVCCFAANVLHGLTGCGSILVLHALWQTAVTFAPDVMHGTDAFGSENVKSIAEFSYVLTFCIQVVLTGLLFFDERRKRARQLEQGMPPTPSELNGVLLLAFIPCSFIGAAVGIYTMPFIHENGSRIILGGSSLFFALTFLSLYQMKYLEKKKTEDVIRDDLMLMRIQSEVQRHVILQYMEEQKRRKARKERRARHRAQRQQAKKEEKVRRRELRMKALAANTVNAATSGSPSNGDNTSPLVVVPSPGEIGNGVAAVSEMDGVPLEPKAELTSLNHSSSASPTAAGGLHQRTRSSSELSNSGSSSRVGRPLEVHGASHLASPHAHLLGDVHLPVSVTGEDNYPVGYLRSPNTRRRHHVHRWWIKEVDVHRFIRQRLMEIGSHVDADDEEVANLARVAAWTLRAMEGREGDPDIVAPYSPADGSPHAGSGSSNSSSSSSTSSHSDTEGDDSTTVTTTTTTSSSHRRHASRSSSSKRTSAKMSDSGSGVEERDPHARTVRFDASAEAAFDAAEREELHKKWRTLLGKGQNDEDGDGEGSIDLSKSIALAAATAPRRVVMGYTEILNIGLREAQQQQLKNLHELHSGEYAHEHKHHRLVHFMRMDGGVVMSAMVSSFFSGLFGSYTGVADPPLTIFALAMDISVPELRINYAVSSIVPAALRAVVGIYDGFANTSLFVYYLVSVLFAWGGVAFGLHISHHNAVTHATFMIATLATLLLVAYLMLVPIDEMVLRLAATAAGLIIVVLAIFRQQKKPERHRPPAPPNTPATQAEVDAFELYWRQHSRKQKALMDYDSEGSALSMSATSTGRMEESLRSANSSSVTAPPQARRGQSASVPPATGVRARQPQRGKDEAPSLQRRSALESEDVPRRCREDAEEELITIVPVKASSPA